jgi:predicted CXXCH cytochrome family protein
MSGVTDVARVSRPQGAPTGWPVSALLVGLWLFIGSPASGGADEVADAPVTGYVGAAVCGDCHTAEFAAWQGSHHDLAMAEATPATMLGDFADAEFTAHGVTTRFFRQGERYMVRTDNADGAPEDFAVAYTFGWEPLQQYLIRFPDGRLQALGIAWDSRPSAEGGQRWFHLYPDEPSYGPNNPLHWTGRDQTWNYQCAECHSTGLSKGYDLEADRYDTRWAEIDVACEACHGPGADHVAQARAVQGADSGSGSGAGSGAGDGAWGPDKGLLVDLATRDGGAWLIDPDTGRPRRSLERTDHTELNACARCHARRGLLHARYSPADALSDTHRLALLSGGLYHEDGQILDEVFVHGSFLQSRMHRAGVTCGDCHEPHSLELRAPGNAVCARCHAAARYDRPEHHHHPVTRISPPVARGSGTACVDCHMPERTYMVVDDRADHSLRVPRPDLSVELGTPNACNGCHADQTAEWAAAAVAEWYPGSDPRAHFARALHAGRRGAVEAPDLLSALALDAEAPSIARATALDLMRERGVPVDPELISALASADDPLQRAAAARALDTLSPDVALRTGLTLLQDPVRLVRIDTARALASFARLEANVPGRESPLRKALAPALAEYREAQLANAERAESWLNLGLLDVALGDAAGAEARYRRALALEADFLPAYVNLADLYRATGRDDSGRTILEEGLARTPDAPDLLHALGLLEIRAQRLQAASDLLERAAELAPEQARYAYVYALAQQAKGDLRGALTTLEATTRRHPNDSAVALALVTLNAEAGDLDAAIRWAERYVARRPGETEAEAMLARLRAAAAGAADKR